MNNNLEFENEDPSPNDFENNHPRTNYGEGFTKQERMYSEEEAIEFFIEGYRQRAIGSNLIFDNASRMYAISLFEQFKKIR